MKYNDGIFCLKIFHMEDFEARIKIKDIALNFSGGEFDII